MDAAHAVSKRARLCGAELLVQNERIILGEGAFGKIIAVQHSALPGRCVAKIFTNNDDLDDEKAVLVHIFRGKSHDIRGVTRYFGNGVEIEGPCLYFERAQTDLFHVGFTVDANGAAHPSLCPGLTASHVSSILHETLLGLQYLDICDVIHADLSPRNILYFGNGRAKLCDFGK
jgi:serine/threonine protein kinase